MRRYSTVLVWACGIVVVGSLLAHEVMMGLAFHLKLFQSYQSACPLKAVLVHSGEDQYQVPIDDFETGFEMARLDVEALPFVRKRVYVEVVFDGCTSIQSKKFIANRGDVFYVHIGDKRVDVNLRSSGALI